jgi:cob(I)alamin adenosyltransferase
MVNLTRIYTRTGDDGTTNLGDMSKTSKLDLRLAAYADVDEANSHIGFAISLGTLDEDVVAVLTHVQNDLFDVGADLSCPVVENPEYPPLRVEPDYIDRLEGWCDVYNESLDKLRSFILPGGNLAAAELHVARTVTRRAERSAWAAIDEHGETMNVRTARYLNRLSDLLFILARHANREAGDVLWVPGGERGEPPVKNDGERSPD